MARFGASARAVDMLGRQQIAGVPTAVSELFKNAYDAYAREVRVDYLPERGLLLLRDDGIGMSESDFLSRWLTLGTDSKARNSSSAPPPRPRGALARTTMGEKGIGRLAIASIGPLLVVLTRPMPREDVDPPTAEPHTKVSGQPDDRPVLVALVAWTLFQTPGLTLDDVDVPTRIISGAERVDQDLMLDLRAEAEANVARLGRRMPRELRNRCLSELAALDIEPAPLFALPGPKLTGEGHGTHFLIAGVGDDLPAALRPSDREQAEDGASPLERLLIGFTDTMLPGRPPPPMRARFLLHQPSEAPRDLIDEAEFWTPEDLSDVDHDIAGEFDEQGSFAGTVSVYQRPPVEYLTAWPGGARGPSRCGPFVLRLGYVQGNPGDSQLDPETFVLMGRKLARIGGLYVYRDGIRVQPYGTADVDYLRIEERRSRRAARYYFSYRRMFGAVEISTEGNPDLQDKASREGLRENGAFRDFRSILENFLVQIAADFFNRGGDQSEEWQDHREVLRLDQQRRRQLDARRRQAGDRYSVMLEEALSGLESGHLRAQLGEVLTRLDEELAEADPDDAEQLAAVEGRARKAIEHVSAVAVIDPPPETGLTSEQRRNLASYNSLLDRFRSTDLPAAAAQVSARVDATASRPRVRRQLDGVRRQGLSNAVRGLKKAADADAEALRSAADRVRHDAVKVAGEAVTAVAVLVARAGLELEADLADPERQRLVDDLGVAVGRQRERLAQLRQALEDTASGGAREENLLLQEQVLDLQQQTEANLELLLLGQAVQVIDHELEAAVGAMRSGLQRLRPWARQNKRLAQAVEDTTTAFTHLDGYLRLFTPLQRRLYRQRADVTGESVAGFLARVFGDRLERHGIRLIATPAFRRRVLRGYPSTFMPVFVNLVDNALHWVSSSRAADGLIRLDADEDGVLVVDNGPGVRERDRGVLFERGFSRRPGGRGLGLTISRAALARERPPWLLELADEQPERGAAFRIRPSRSVGGPGSQETS